MTDPRYSKNQLLDLYRLQQSVDDGLQEDLQSLYIGGWQPNAANGVPAAGWGRTDASREQPPGPDVCWDDDGHFEPLSLTQMDDEEREVRTTDILGKINLGTKLMIYAALHVLGQYPAEAADSNQQRQSTVERCVGS